MSSCCKVFANLFFYQRSFKILMKLLITSSLSHFSPKFWWNYSSHHHWAILAQCSISIPLKTWEDRKFSESLTSVIAVFKKSHETKTIIFFKRKKEIWKILFNERRISLSINMAKVNFYVTFMEYTTARIYPF